MYRYCAGIVTYQPDTERLRECLESVVDQFDQVIIVDNASNKDDEIRTLVEPYNNVDLVINSDNEGIARAFNKICNIAIQNGCEWILTLDQDTVIPEDTLMRFTQYISDNNIAIICPAVYYEGWNKLVKGDDSVDYVKACMTSGSFTRLSVWQDVGGFKEEYFIDFVDNEYCMRLNLAGYRILRVNSCVMKHRLGDSDIKIPHHSPLRNYYMTRNYYLFIKEYAKHLPVCKERIKLRFLIFQELWFNKDRRETIRMIKRGLSDAKKGITGKFNE